MLKRFLPFLLLLAFVPASRAQTKTWTWVQDSPVIFCGQGGSKQTCTIQVAQIAPTQPGSVWVIQIMTPNNVTITSVTGGGGTWTHCSNCHVFNPSGFSIDAAYNVSGNAGTTTGITINLSGQSGTFFNINFMEALPPSGSTGVFDDSGSTTGTNCTTCTSVQLNNITGTDIIFHNPGGAAQQAWNSWSAPYVTDENGGAYSLNTTSGTAPTSTFSGVSNPSFLAIAFKSTAGVFTPPVPQYSIVNFKAVTQTCSPTCNISFPATGSGHLLFVMAADLNNDHITAVTGGGSWVVPSGANTCQIFYVQAGNNAFSCAYVLSSTGGATSFNVTLNGNSSTGFGIWEIATTNGSFVFDTQGSHVNAASFAPPGQALTLTGTNDVIFQGGFVPGGASAASVYPQTYILNNGAGYILFNEASEAMMLDSGPTPLTPIWLNPQNNATSAFGIAFKTANATYTAVSCLESDVQAAYTTEQANKIDGDVIAIPACPGGVTWSSSWSISPSNSLTFLGAGSQSTTGGGDQTVILDGVSHSPSDVATWSIGTAAGKSFRISGITIQNGAGNAGSFNGAIRIGGNSTALRVDHSRFQVGPIMFDVGGATGVFDHNIFDQGTNPGGVTNAVRMEQPSLGGVGTFGDNSWATPSNLGSANSLYMENNIINGGFVNDCINGGRYVIRFNTINNAVIQEHSTGSGQRHRGCRAWEDYHNTFVCAGTCTANGSGPVNFDAHFMTAGTGVMWGDTASAGFTNFATLRNNRSNNQTYGQSPTPTGWGYCGTAFNGTGSAWDQNLNPSDGYACLDQIGRGQGDLMSGDFPPFGPGATNTTTGTIAWPHQALEPIYEWLNTWTAVPNNPGQFWSVAGGAVIAANRDYYNYTGSFNGTAGVGSGLLASRPATCTAGVAYWAINQGVWNQSGNGGQGVLYKCTSTNIWSQSYSPLAYPYPLVGAGAPVTGPVSDIYLAAANAGLANGANCGNALAATYFNSSANWGIGITQIGGGTTVHLCGIVTSSLTAPASQGTGTITILFEPGASMQQAAAQNFISIIGKTNSYLITGQARCGFQGQAFVPCTEGIKNTANGSPGNFANSVTVIKAIDTSNTTGSVTVQDLEIGPLYVHNDINDAAFSNGAILANAVSGDVMLGSLTLQDSYVHDTSFALTMNPRQASATAPNGPPVLTIQRVEFFHNDHDIYLGPACNPACYSVEIGWIHSHDHTNWNTTANAYHHDGIHIAGGQNTASQTNIHHSLFDGPWNGNGTNPVFNQVAAQNLNAYNNIFICNAAAGCTNVPAAQWEYGGGPNQLFVNNTVIVTGLPRGAGPAFTNDSGILMNNPSGNSVNVTHMNNIVDSAANEINFTNTVFAPNTGTSGLDYNLYSNPITNGNKNFTWQGTLTDSFLTWKQLSGEGIHSQMVGNGLLAADGTPQTGSPAIGTGTNLTSLCVGTLLPLCTDYNGRARPAVGAWNIGAIGNPNGGCGNSLLYDETDCGATAVTPYSAIDPAITVANGTQITNCGFTLTSGTNYFLAGNIGSSATANCLTFTGLLNVNVDLGGFTVTGAVSLTTASGANQKVHIYHGGITCSLSGGTSNSCLNINNNQTIAVAGAFKFHHLTIQNTFDSGTNNITSTGTPFAVGGDLGHNTLTGDSFALYFQYNTVLMTNNNYASGRTGAVQIIGGLAPLMFSNNLITIGGGEAASQGIVCYGCVSGSQINNNAVNLALSLYGSPNVSSRAFMLDASQGTSVNPLEIAFNDVVTNDHRCVRVRDSNFPYVHDNYCRGVRFGGASGSSNGTLGAIHMGDPNSFPSTAITNIACAANATAVDGCTITLSGTQNWVGHEGDVITISAVTPVSLQETVTVTSGNPSTPNTVKYASNSVANNNVSSSGAVAFVYSNAMNGLVLNNTFQVDCTVNKGAIVFADRASTGNVFNLNTITTNGDCTTSFAGALFKRYLNAAKDNFTIKNTTLTNPLGGASYPLLATSGGPSGTLQQFGFFCSTLSINGVTDGDPGWSVAASCPGAALATLSQTTAAFFNQMAGTTTSLPTLVTLTNNGGAPLTISGFAMNGSNPTEFNQTNNCGTGLAAGISCTISITFSPSALGPRSATLNVNDNAAGSPQIVTLSGNGFKTIAGGLTVSGQATVKVGP